MASIYTMGELLVEIMRDRVDVPLDTTGTFLGPFPSGAPGIFISTVAQLGHTGKIWGGVGKDRFGSLLLEKLKGDGVDCSDVQVVNDASTAVAFIAYDSTGEREFIFHVDRTPACEISFSEDDAPAPEFFHVMGCSLMINDQVLPIVDPTGAGDSFDAAFFCALSEGKDLATAGAYAAKAAAINSTAQGPISGDLRTIGHDYLNEGPCS